MSKYIKENSFAGFFLSSLNNHNKESVMRALKKVKVDEKIPILNKDTNVTDYTRSDYYLGREVNKYLEIDFLDCNYEHAILFDRFLIPTFNSFEVYPHFESLNNLVDGMIFYKFELPEIYNYKLDKLKKMTGYKDINDIIQRARKNITNRHIDVRYDKSDIYELINILNDKYNMQDSLNRLLRSYAAQSIDLTMYDNLYPNPYKTSAAWDGTSSRTHKIYFTNLPATCEINIFTSNGDLIATLKHNAETYVGQDSKWFSDYGDGTKTIMSGGEHAWDLLSNYKTNVSSGVYLFTVKDLKTEKIEIGKFAILK